MLFAAAPAGAYLWLAADATGDTGYIGLAVIGSGAFTHVDLGERAGGSIEPLKTLTPTQFATAPGAEPVSVAYLPRATARRCGRLSRHFVAVGHRADGAVERADFTVRTPSCRDRLLVTVPRSVRRGDQILVKVRDRWRTGGVRGQLCHRAPGAPRRCQALRIRTGSVDATQAFRARREGRLSVELRAPDVRIRRTVSVGVPPASKAPVTPVVLTTGDSLMQSVDALLGDRLAKRAELRSDVHIGSGLTKKLVVDWRTLPRKQVGEHHPDATVLFLGANDAGPMTTPGGSRVNCCEDPWIAEYARRARGVMRAYVRKKGGAVIWLNIPAAKDPRRTAASTAVNVGLERAAAGLSRVKVLDMAGLFTPGGRYRDFMAYRGKRVRVRQSDGIHLSLAGADIAAGVVIRQLKRFGVL